MILGAKISESIDRVASKVRERVKSRRRSPRWDEVRDNFLERNPACAACGSVRHLQVHHINPFHTHPELELVQENLITLCMDTSGCHLKLGHGGSFSTFNPSVVEDAVEYLNSAPAERRKILEEAKKHRIK